MKQSCLSLRPQTNSTRPCVALSVMCDLPIGVVERAVSASGADQLIVLVRAIGLSWRTTSAIIMVGSRSKGALANDFEQIASSFHKLSRDTAEKAIKFYRLRDAQPNKRPSDNRGNWYRCSPRICPRDRIRRALTGSAEPREILFFPLRRMARNAGTGRNA